MATTIKGLTVQIGADTSSFTKELRKLNTETNAVTKRADALQNSLKLKWDNQKYLDGQNQLKDALQKAEEAAKKTREQLDYLKKNDTGEGSSAQFLKLQEQLEKTEANAEKLRQKLDQLNQLKLDRLPSQLKSIGDSISNVGQKLTPLSVAAGGALAGLAAIGKTTITTAATLDDLSQQIGLNVEELQKWQYIAMQTGVENTTLQTGFVKVQAALADFASGTSSNATKALEKLGITSQEAVLGMDKNFNKIIEALSGIEDPILQASYANEIFGDKLGSRIVPLLRSGGDALATLTEEFESLGYITNEEATALAQFDDQLNRIKTAFAQIRNEIGVALLPVMQSFADIVQARLIPFVKQLADWFNNLSDSQKKLVVTLLALTAALAPALMIIGKVVSGVGSLIKVLQALRGALTLLAAHPIVAIIMVVIGILLLMYTRVESFREAVNRLVESLTSALAPVLTLISNTLTDLVNQLMPLIDILLNVVAAVLTPILEILNPIIQLIGQLLIPYIQIMMLKFQPFFILLKALSPLFIQLGDVIKSVFGGIPGVISPVVKFMTDAFNAIIGVINWVIEKINKLFGWTGLHLNELDEVEFKMEESITNNNATGTSGTTTTNPEDTLTGSDQIINGGNTTNNSTINNDYSNKDITINVNVYTEGEDIDVDKLVDQINVKLAQQL